MTKNTPLTKASRLGVLCLGFFVAIICVYAIRDNLITDPNSTLVAQKSSTQDAEQKKATISEQAKTNIPNFAAFKDVVAKKEAFFGFLRPMITRQNVLISNEQEQIVELNTRLNNGQRLSQVDIQLFDKLAKKYKVFDEEINTQSLDSLLRKIDVVPESLVLIQAANETGWGSSRFALKGNNFFGQWCFKEGCGLVPLSRTSGLKHEVAVFDSVEDSVASYMNNLNTNAAYKQLRNIRYELREEGAKPKADDLIHGLINYSERKEEYVNELLNMLRHNEKYLVTTNALQ